MFAGDIDFLQDLRRGDRFSVLYETRYVEGEPVGTGRIVAAEFVNRGIRCRRTCGRTPTATTRGTRSIGRSTRKAFLRSPMEFSRMTSGFSLARFHPILQTWRAHRGVDYAAPAGTPVRATADGVVAMCGFAERLRQRDRGHASRCVLHALRATCRASPRRFADGARVQQGEVIGYVGVTGWATGPHLHYEFRIDDQARNPLSVALPNAGPMPPESFGGFLLHIEPLAQQLALARQLPAARFASSD